MIAKVRRYNVMLPTLKPIGPEEAVTGVYHEELHSVVLASDYDALQAKYDALDERCIDLIFEIKMVHS